MTELTVAWLALAVIPLLCALVAALRTIRVLADIARDNPPSRKDRT